MGGRTKRIVLGTVAIALAGAGGYAAGQTILSTNDDARCTEARAVLADVEARRDGALAGLKRYDERRDKGLRVTEADRLAAIGDAVDYLRRKSIVMEKEPDCFPLSARVQAEAELARWERGLD